jgi:formate dehydrogenase subunit gamma
MSKPQLVRRYSSGQRANHWITAICFILLAASGLALFHPAFFFLTNLLGGGTWSRILHPFIGVVLAVSFFIFAAQMWGQNRITEADREWRKHLGEILSNRAGSLPPIGKYNIGQKYLFWTLVTVIALLLVSGIVIWQPYFAPRFPIDLVRLAVLVHAVAGFVGILAIIIHIYSAYWVKGSIRAMTRGTVTAAWAKHHHPAWYKEISKGNR